MRGIDIAIKIVNRDISQVGFMDIIGEVKA